MIGPNMPPTFAVPRDCTRNSANQDRDRNRDYHRLQRRLDDRQAFDRR